MHDQAPYTRACLLIHGFTGGPFELEPLTAALAEAGWDCRAPELPGHGSMAATLGRVTYRDWLEAVSAEARALQAQYGSFDLVGFSMGGMLAVHVAARYKVRRLVLLSAAAIYMSPSRFVREWWKRKREHDPTLSLKMRQTPLRAVWEFMKTVRAVRGDLARVKAPTLVLHGLQDHIVHPKSAAYIRARVGGACSVRYLPASRHLICLEEEQEQVLQAVVEFLGAPEEAVEAADAADAAVGAAEAAGASALCIAAAAHHTPEPDTEAEA